MGEGRESKEAAAAHLGDVSDTSPKNEGGRTPGGRKTRGKLTKVVRLWNGPTFRGSKPILVSFHLYKDKEEILRKNAAYLKGQACF